MEPVKDADRADTILNSSDADSAETVIPVYVEEAAVTKRQIATGRVRVSTVTHLHERVVDELLARERVEVERKPVGKPVETVPQTREENDTLIVPVVEEEIVVTRRLVLKEEIHIRRIRETEKFQDRIQLRKQEATITRLSGDSAAADQTSSVSSLNQLQSKEK